LKVAILAPPWLPVPPPAYGGTEAMLDGLARGLAQAGHEVLLYTTGDSTCPVPRSFVFERSVGVPTAGPAAELRHVIRAYEEVAADFDIVHDHTLVGPIYAERFPWLPVVTTNHGPFQGDLVDLYRAIGPRVPLIAISRSQAAAAKDLPIAAIIHHGVDPGRFPLGPGGGGYALFLGRMAPEKGVATAARVARAAGIPLLIAAKMQEPAELAYFESEVRPLLGGGVEYVGEVGWEDKLRLLAGATCLLNPIAWPEPFGMVMIEALACGTPVVATSWGAAPEIVRDGVTGFIRDSEAGLAAVLDQVEHLSRQACRDDLERRFSLRRMVAEHVQLYEQVLGARTKASASPPNLLGMAP
jgi:glycosyltransferase involved in cell wall biosynthesis